MTARLYGYLFVRMKYQTKKVDVYLQLINMSYPVQTSRLHIICFLAILVLVFQGCMPARRLPEDQYLLNRNRIRIEDADVETHELRSYVRQEPNRRILWFYRFHLNVYQFADRGRETRIRQWMKNTIGEPPVIFNQALADQTNRQFELFLQNKGYFNAEVTYDVTYRRKRANVTYSVQGNEPYTIRNINYAIRDNHLAGFVLRDSINSLLESGQRYDADILQKERQRITRHLKEEGFFNFSRDFVFFQVDSTLNTRQLDVEILINSPRAPGIPEQGQPAAHRRYKINNVFIYPEYSRLLPNQHFSDTTAFRIENGEEGALYTFLHNGPMAIRPKAIANNIMLESDDYFNIRRLEQTHGFLAGLRNFRFVNVQFMPLAAVNNEVINDTLGLLDVRIELTRAPSNAFTIEAEGLNTAGNLGIAGNLMFQNRNVFSGAEMLNVRFKGALEVSGESADEEVFQRLPFNTLELGTEVSIDFPKLLLPFRTETLSRTARPQTTVLTGINYRQRPDYTRYVFNVSYGFNWRQDNRRHHQLTPIEISSIKIFNDSILQSRIPDANPLILSRYRDHLIGGPKYTYNYSTQQIEQRRDFIYFRGNLESSGNLMYVAASRLNGNKDESGSYTIFGIPFAQYLKADADFRYYRFFDENNALVFRIMGGIGVPYGNIDVMPFIKSYYSGGANSIRAWSIYNLGPGGYPEAEELRFDKYGDIKLEANIELRFPLYRYWKGAFFLDAGNVWFLKENEQFALGHFALNRFYKEVAIGAGLGLRVDFDFFIVRLDAATPLRNPALPEGERWASSMPRFSSWNFNLGIGYPF